MNADDILFAPILPPEAEEKLRDIIRRVMKAPRNDSYTNQVTHEIVDLLNHHGFTDTKEIGDIVGRIINDLGGP